MPDFFDVMAVFDTYNSGKEIQLVSQLRNLPLKMTDDERHKLYECMIKHGIIKVSGQDLKSFIITHEPYVAKENIPLLEKCFTETGLSSRMKPDLPIVRKWLTDYNSTPSKQPPSIQNKTMKKTGGKQKRRKNKSYRKRSRKN